MSFEQFKTQVLLLHSEQSTLDKLSSGFTDRYTVHCATSGSEALNTLGTIQIDVIVSAQELPGMSGLDALREAKKRSPETIGILLAGNAGEGLEAMVGDKEVFQIVRGSVTPESLKSLIDGATQQARLIALAESANDMTANPDMTGEHIIMETSENGSTIISDGTGRMPALDPDKISVAAGVGSRSVDVLVLTHDDEFLSTVKESARGLHNVIYANTVSQADEAIRKHKIGVAVVDAAMVGTNVEKLTMHLRSQSPRLVAIVAGRRDDGDMLMDLINRGRVYRFLLKPVSPGRSRLAIEASVKHHLEAPDSAFKVSRQPAPAPKPEARPEPKPAPKPVAKAPPPKPEPKPAARPAARPAPVQNKEQPAKKAPPAAPAAAEKPAAKPAARPAADAAIVPNRREALSPVDEGLGDAFGGSDTSFTETMTGIVETVTKSFRSGRKEPKPAEQPASSSAMDIDHLTASSGGSFITDPKVLGIGATALVAIAAAGFWFFSGSDDTSVDSGAPQPVAESAQAPRGPAQGESVLATEVVVPQVLGVDDLIDEARLAADAGQVYAPPGNNAIELYLEALDVAPGDPVAQLGLDEAVEQALGMAESALLARRTNDALAALAGVELGDPDNARLTFLKAQLTQMRLRDNLDTARAAIRESRFEDAQDAISAANRLNVTDKSEIVAVADELNAALSDQRVDEVIAEANARLDEGRLIAPSNDNARYYYELALSIDPGNAAARQGLTVIAGKLVLEARQQIDAGELDAAGRKLADARRVDPSSSEVAATEAVLQSARDRREEDIRAAANKAAQEQAAAQRAAAERAAAEQAAAEQAEAERIAAAAAAAERAAAERAAAERRTAELATALRTGATPSSAGAAPAAAAAASQPPAQEPVRREPPVAQPVQSAPATDRQSFAVAGSGDTVETGTPVRSTPPPQQAAVTPQEPDPVAASSLNRTKYVPPRYPRSAERREISGWVDVIFTVDIDGKVTDISVRDSNPGETFVGAAINAVEKWEFEPVIENGVAIQKRAAVRMMFAIE